MCLCTLSGILTGCVLIHKFSVSLLLPVQYSYDAITYAPNILFIAHIYRQVKPVCTVNVIWTIPKATMLPEIYILSSTCHCCLYCYICVDYTFIVTRIRFYPTSQDLQNGNFFHIHANPEEGCIADYIQGKLFRRKGRVTKVK